MFIIATVSRPTDEEGKRVTPSDLQDHRITHAFKGPCCLCAAPGNIGIEYSESAIYEAALGEYLGEYVAGCATGRCGYLSEFGLSFILY
jgi:hypothetical protein